MTPLVQLDEVCRTYTLGQGPPVTALGRRSLVVRAGEVVALVGRSGSGKSTLLNIVGMLDKATSGSYLLDGRDVAQLSDSARARVRQSQFGFVFQQFHLIDHRTAVDNVAEPLLYGPWRDVAIRRLRARALLDSVGLADRHRSLPHQLSGGEQQRVAIARALIGSPKLICADEPTGSLDPATGDAVLAILFRQVKEHNASLVIATHDPVVAARADRVIEIEPAGRLVH